MSRPDLETDEGRAAYRQELRQVGRPIRLGGLALVLIGALFTLAATRGMLGLNEGVVVVGYALLAVGWAMFVAATFLRTRHHRRRLMEGL